METIYRLKASELDMQFIESSSVCRRLIVLDQKVQRTEILI
jgi:hypothetical protein